MGSHRLDKRICLDPGHPSENGAGASRGALTEIGIAWRVSLRLRDLLTAAGAAVTMTKSAERQKVTNRRRAEIANAWRSDLSLRLHCDAAPGISGIAVYYPSTEGVTPDGRRGPSALVIRDSQRLAHGFHTGLIESLHGALRDRGVLTDHETAIGRRQGALTGSIYAETPVILVEMVVLTDAGDADFLEKGAGEERLAKALFSGVTAAFPT